MPLLESIKKDCEDYVVNSDVISSGRCKFFIDDIDCVILNCDDSLPNDESCDYLIFLEKRNSLSIILLDFKSTERTVSELEKKFRYSDAFVMMILSGVCGIEVSHCNFLFMQVVETPNTSPDIQRMKQRLKMPGGKFQVALEYCGAHLADTLINFPPKRRGFANPIDHLQHCG